MACEKRGSRVPQFLYHARIMSEVSETVRPNLPEFSVSEIAAALKRTVEDAFPFVRVRGEVSNLKFHSSGHVYFDLKDDKACLNAVIWRTTAQRLHVKPEQGLEVVCTGRVTTYAGSSRYQIVVEQVELAGLGALMAMLEARRKKLAAEGLFDASHKKKLPFLPDVIGVITSPTGAVIRDIMHRLSARFPRRVMLWPVPVQGDRAAAEIVAALRGFNALGAGGRLPRPDLIIVARGGGSTEDLMPFNDEDVVRAVFASAIPVISAVGHETDTTLIDFVSDLRAPTPSAAAELAVPVRSELLAQLIELERRRFRALSKALEQRRTHLTHLARILPAASQLFAEARQRLDLSAEKLGHALAVNREKHVKRFAEAGARLRPNAIRKQLALGRERAKSCFERLKRAQRTRLAEIRRSIDALSRMLDGMSYRAVLERGFALVRAADGAIHRRAATLAPGEALSLTFADGTAGATVSGRQAESKPRTAARVPAKSQGTLF
jgi:exodeoxyribonuclease VII large subunit